MWGIADARSWARPAVPALSHAHVRRTGHSQASGVVCTLLNLGTGMDNRVAAKEQSALSISDRDACSPARFWARNSARCYHHSSEQLSFRVGQRRVAETLARLAQPARFVWLGCVSPHVAQRRESLCKRTLEHSRRAHFVPESLPVRVGAMAFQEGCPAVWKESGGSLAQT